MIDSQTPQAFTILENPGVFALLLSSGLSRPAGIPHQSFAPTVMAGGEGHSEFPSAGSVSCERVQQDDVPEKSRMLAELPPFKAGMFGLDYEQSQVLLGRVNGWSLTTSIRFPTCVVTSLAAAITAVPMTACGINKLSATTGAHSAVVQN
jgi:hypothetical protein